MAKDYPLTRQGVRNLDHGRARTGPTAAELNPCAVGLHGKRGRWSVKYSDYAYPLWEERHCLDCGAAVEFRYP